MHATVSEVVGFEQVCEPVFLTVTSQYKPPSARTSSVSVDVPPPDKSHEESVPVHAFADTETPSANSSSDVVAPLLERVTARLLLDSAKAEPVNMSFIVAAALTDQSETS